MNKKVVVFASEKKQNVVQKNLNPEKQMEKRKQKNQTDQNAIGFPFVSI